MSIDLPYINRELSWVNFNMRVLEEAINTENPPLERLKFISITSSNLDEFIMVRVGGLHLMRKEGKRKADPSGLTPYAQLKAINKKVKQMVELQYYQYCNSIEPILSQNGFIRRDYSSLTKEHKKYVDSFVKRELYPIISPSAVSLEGIRPLIQNLIINILVRIEAKKDEQERYAIMPLAQSLKRFIVLPSDEDKYEYILLEDAIKANVGMWFEGENVLESVAFRPTRNGDIELQEDEAPDLMAGMEDVLEQRISSDCIRIEVENGVSRASEQFLLEFLNCDKSWMFKVAGPLDLKVFMSLAFVDGFDDLKIEQWQPQRNKDIDPSITMFEQIKRGDLLMYHPYESFDPVIRFIEEASVDPDVLAIKLVVYRTSPESPIIMALKNAAENGKCITVLVELKARFDEHSNILWAKLLEKAGVQVIYGVKGLKTHSKICVVIRREDAGIVRYVHYGTGNYNDKTAKIYGDIGYMTCNEALGTDATSFFNAVSGYSQPQNLKRIYMSPMTLRKKLVDMIDGEIERKKNGFKALIIAKMNSLVDIELIKKLYEASQAGVEIKLNVRGICCLVPGLEGFSENITVTSIIDRYLEHARIYYFHQGGNEQVFISSADWMTRNLDKRVELLVPIEAKDCKSRLIKILNVHLSDNVKSWKLLPDGEYVRDTERKGKKDVRSQEKLYLDACKKIMKLETTVIDKLTPHTSSSF